MNQVASHFYSYSFALNPDWTRKYSLQTEIQAYFRSVAEQYRVVEHIRFRSVVEKAEWEDADKVWVVSILDLMTKERTTRRAKILISGVGSLSVPRKCELPGVETFKGPIFHSAEWDHTFDWKNKDIVVIGNIPFHPNFSVNLTQPRQWLFRYSIPPYNGKRPQRRTQHRPIRPTSSISFRAHQSDLLFFLQSHDEILALRHASIPL